MHSSLLLTGLTAITGCLGSPLVKRSNYAAPPGGDTDILNYALTLEYLERDFYRQALANYTCQDFIKAGLDETFYTNLKVIAYDERSHVSFLATALGSAAVKQASYRFPSTTAKQFVALASILEGVGVSAYLGAAAAIVNPAYLTAAGSILVTESRHSATIRSAIGQEPIAKPYDTPLNFNQVFSLAAQFITGFAPGSAPLPFKAFPSLTAVPSANPVCPGQGSVTFQGAYSKAAGAGLVSASTPVYAVFFSGLDSYYVPVKVSGNDYVSAVPGANYSMAGQLPPGGQTYVVLSTANGTTKVSDETTLSGVGILEFLTTIDY